MPLSKEQTELAQKLYDEAVSNLAEIYKLYRQDDIAAGIFEEKSNYDYLHEAIDFDDLCADIAAKMHQG